MYANRHYLAKLREASPEQLAACSEGGPEIVGDVVIDPSATIHPSAKVRACVVVILCQGVVLRIHNTSHVNILARLLPHTTCRLART